jgi:hypothetical protein
MEATTIDRIHQIPAPAAKEPGWYRDPLGSGLERYWDRSWMDLTRLQHEPPAPSSAPSNGAAPRKGLLSFVGLKPSAGDQSGSTAADPKGKRKGKKAKEGDERKREFFASPAGQARLAFGQKHSIFQCRLSLSRPELFVIPGVEDAAPLITSDPNQILNSVVSEGWKLDAGSYFWADGDGAVIGYYLFKRSKKRLRPMNDPWKREPAEL